MSLFGMDPRLYDLYLLDSSQALPQAQPISLHRGERFEAQRKAQAGEQGPYPMTLEQEADALRASGLPARLIVAAGQRYVLISDIPIPSPPWSRSRTDILIAIPAGYTGFPSPVPLDGFRVEWPIEWNGGIHPRIHAPGENVVEVEGRKWRLVSWHYRNDASWRFGVDRLATHIDHCRGFFLSRGIM